MGVAERKRNCNLDVSRARIRFSPAGRRYCRAFDASTGDGGACAVGRETVEINNSPDPPAVFTTTRLRSLIKVVRLKRDRGAPRLIVTHIILYAVYNGNNNILYDVIVIVPVIIPPYAGRRPAKIILRSSGVLGVSPRARADHCCGRRAPSRAPPHTIKFRRRPSTTSRTGPRYYSVSYLCAARALRIRRIPA